MYYNTFDENAIKDWPYTNLIFSTPSNYHNHTFWEFSFIISGSSQNIMDNGMARTLKLGDAYLMRPRDIHCVKVKSELYRHRDIYISDERMKQICDTLSPTLYDMLNSAEYPTFFKLDSFSLSVLQEQLKVFNLNSGHKSELLDAYHASIISFLLGMIVKAQLLSMQAPPEWLSTFIIQLHDIGYMSMRIEQLCSLTKYSQGYLSRIVKKYFGVTLEQFIINLRMEYSTQLLDSNEYSILQIANMVGYDSSNNFTNNFKRKYGISPSKWRKSKN